MDTVSILSVSIESFCWQLVAITRDLFQLVYTRAPTSTATNIWWPPKHVRLASGRYGFYWNAFLLTILTWAGCIVPFSPLPRFSSGIHLRITKRILLVFLKNIVKCSWYLIQLDSVDIFSIVLFLAVYQCNRWKRLWMEYRLNCARHNHTS